MSEWSHNCEAGKAPEWFGMGSCEGCQDEGYAKGLRAALEAARVARKIEPDPIVQEDRCFMRCHDAVEQAIERLIEAEKGDDGEQS